MFASTVCCTRMATSDFETKKACGQAALLLETLAVITFLVVGILGASGSIIMSPFVAYSLIGAAPGLIFLDLLTTSLAANCVKIMRAQLVNQEADIFKI